MLMMLDPCSIELFLDNEILNLRRKKTNEYLHNNKKSTEREGERRGTAIHLDRGKQRREKADLHIVAKFFSTLELSHSWILCTSAQQNATREKEEDRILCTRVCFQIFFCLYCQPSQPLARPQKTAASSSNSQKAPICEKIILIRCCALRKAVFFIIYSYHDYISFEPILWSNSLVMRFDFFYTHTHTRAPTNKFSSYWFYWLL